ncbi:hypothetical protein Tco_0200325 [Tanacetum coccineum]
MSASQDEIPPPPPPPPSSPQTPTQQTPHTVSTIKLPILKKGEYDIWAMNLPMSMSAPEVLYGAYLCGLVFLGSHALRFSSPLQLGM